MSGFDSPNFKKSVGQRGRMPLREFTVGALEDNDLRTQSGVLMNEIQQSAPTPQQNVEDVERALTAARKAKADLLVNGDKITDTAKRRIELLGNIGRLTKDVKIGEYTFSIRTLKAKETQEAALATFVNVKTDLEASFEARKQQLARSIFKINDEDVNIVLPGNTAENIFALLDNMEEVAVGKLWDEFAALKEESKSKYGINSAKDAEEVAEDLKK